MVVADTQKDVPGTKTKRERRVKQGGRGGGGLASRLFNKFDSDRKYDPFADMDPVIQESKAGMEALLAMCNPVELNSLCGALDIAEPAPRSEKVQKVSCLRTSIITSRPSVLSSYCTTYHHQLRTSNLQLADKNVEDPFPDYCGRENVAIEAIIDGERADLLVLMPSCQRADNEPYSRRWPSRGEEICVRVASILGRIALRISSISRLSTSWY